MVFKASEAVPMCGPGWDLVYDNRVTQGEGTDGREEQGFAKGLGGQGNDLGLFPLKGLKQDNDRI